MFVTSHHTITKNALIVMNGIATGANIINSEHRNKKAGILNSSVTGLYFWEGIVGQSQREELCNCPTKAGGGRVPPVRGKLVGFVGWLYFKKLFSLTPETNYAAY